MTEITTCQLLRVKIRESREVLNSLETLLDQVERKLISPRGDHTRLVDHIVTLERWFAGELIDTQAKCSLLELELEALKERGSRNPSRGSKQFNITLTPAQIPAQTL